MLAKVPKGMKDVLPAESARWRAMEAAMRETALLAGYREIRTPVLEHTSLFTRAAGETSDVVRKEMYTFLDKGDRSLTLKPESTAAVVRAVLESGLYAQALPLKLYYVNTPHFRYEAPQSGRLREHHQFGLECFGAAQATADAELIILAMSLLAGLGLQKLKVRINSIGCSLCRPTYQQKLRDYLNNKRNKLCRNCQERIQTNPMRVLDCKVDSCIAELQDVPVMLNFLCEDCHYHFEQLQTYLSAIPIRYTTDPRIVRGLDYYTKTVFEITTETQNDVLSVCGGGRYDGLVEELGGPSMPAAGFGMGMERVLMLLDQLYEEDHRLVIQEESPEVMVTYLSQKLAPLAFSLVGSFRTAGIRADMDHQGRSLKAQFKYADKLRAKFVAVLGDDEVTKGTVKLRDMHTKEEWEVELGIAPQAIRLRIGH